MTQPEVTIEQGTLRGSLGTDLRGNNFYKFQGIPYAKPPLGELRFKAPVPPEKWTGIFDATKEGDISYSVDPLQNNKIAGSENCLVLNVYTKKLDADLKPVLFWIHGGGFVCGQGGEDLYAPDFLITEDVVVVTINYRLGIFGFVNFEDPSLEIPGNAGLKDQVMALKWVQKNISTFGGDPNNVTIFGQSAGGASVHLHILSPMSKGLFHKAIAQSGCALNPWVRGTPGVKKIAEAMELGGADERTVYNALMKKSKEEILGISAKIMDKMVANEYRPVGVVVEKNSKEAFLPDEPINLMVAGKFTQVPLILGYTSKEGMLFEILREKELEKIVFDTFIPHSFGYKTDSTESKNAGQQIKKFYFGDGEPSESNLSKIYDIYTDCHFLYGIYVTIMTHLSFSKTPIYVYRVSIETELNFFKKFLQITIPGVSHCDEIGYLFKHFLTPEIKPGSVEDVSLSKFVKLWTNFAKFGNPTPDKNDSLLKATWNALAGPNLSFLDIGNDLVFKTDNPEMERIEFWKKLFAESPSGQKTQCAYLKSK